MTRKNPILLPGKELWAIHYDVMATARMPKTLREKELKPLFKLASKRGWLTQEESTQLLEQCVQGTLNTAWDKCQMYLTGLNPKEEEDGQAIASWLTLYNLIKYQNLVKSVRPPYSNLKTEGIGIIKDNLIRSIEIELIENKHLRECKRHFLGILLCELCTYHSDWILKEDKTMGYSWNRLTKEMTGREYYTQNLNVEPKNPWILTPSHGLLVNEKWLLPPINIVEEKIKELYNIIPIHKDSNLSKIAKTLAI